MKFSKQEIRWAIAGLWGNLFGWSFLSPLHHAFVNLGLHGLGYDNKHPLSSTGEDWFIQKILTKEHVRTCIDIGANVGSYSATLSRFLPEATLYALEPLSSSFEALQKRDISNLHPIRAAIGDTNGTVHLFSKRAGWEAATIHRELLENTEVSIEEEVPLFTLDTLIEKYAMPAIDFVKIDTEGNELEVLRGMRRLLKNSPPRFIQFEFGVTHLYRGHTLRMLARELPQYQLYRLLPHGMLKIDPEKHVNNVFLFSNIIAKRK